MESNKDVELLPLGKCSCGKTHFLEERKKDVCDYPRCGNPVTHIFNNGSRAYCEEHFERVSKLTGIVSK